MRVPDTVLQPFVLSGVDNIDPSAPPLDTLKPEDYPRGWWMMRGEAGRRSYTNFDECLEHVRTVLDTEGPFDAFVLPSSRPIDFHG
mgnify:CR=1 FL=1